MAEIKVTNLVDCIACACLLAFWGIVLWIDDNPSKYASIGVSLTTGWYLHKVMVRIKSNCKEGSTE